MLTRNTETAEIVREFVRMTECCRPEMAAHLAGIRVETYLKWTINPPRQLHSDLVTRIQDFVAKRE